MNSRYVKQPRKGDTLETGRYGAVTVEEVHAHGRVLLVRSGRGFETIERAETGWWVRLATADGEAIPVRPGFQWARS